MYKGVICKPNPPGFLFLSIKFCWHTVTLICLCTLCGCLHHHGKDEWLRQKPYATKSKLLAFWPFKFAGPCSRTKKLYIKIKVKNLQKFLALVWNISGWIWVAKEVPWILSSFQKNYFKCTLIYILNIFHGNGSEYGALGHRQSLTYNGTFWWLPEVTQTFCLYPITFPMPLLIYILLFHTGYKLARALNAQRYHH